MSHLLYELFIATAQTLYMVTLSTIGAVILGLPLGTLLFSCKVLKPHPWLANFLSSFINITRSIPFIILIVALIPFTRLLIGTSIGIHAAIIPLILGATPFFARLVVNIYQNLSPGLIETGWAMAANIRHMIRYLLIPEALGSLIHATAVTAITLVNYSAMAGTVGGGGLGDLAIRYGYQRFNMTVMIATIIILIVIVQLIQFSGDKLAKIYTRGES